MFKLLICFFISFFTMSSFTFAGPCDVISGNKTFENAKQADIALRGKSSDCDKAIDNALSKDPELKCKFGNGEFSKCQGK